LGGALLMIAVGAVVVYLVRSEKKIDPAIMVATDPLALNGEPPKAKSLLDSKTAPKVNPPPPSPPPTAPEPTTIRQGAGGSKGAEKKADSGALIVPPKPLERPKPEPVDLTGGTEGAKAPVPPPTLSTSLAASASGDTVRALIDEGDRKLAGGDPVGARGAYNKALHDRRTVRADEDVLRAKIAQINEELVFSNKVYKNDPVAVEYTVAGGDNPSKIAHKQDLTTEPSLIQRINKIDPRKLQVGQKLKLLRGPFHAVVHKDAYRLDLYFGSPDDQAEWMYIKSFRVGLGSDNGTPTGTFVVKSNSKLVNPHWTNPRTGERFDADDPKNPIGERWIGIEGVGASTVHTGYGLHGTIDPESIGQQKSMGCVRLGSEDVALLYDMLIDKISVVKIEP
jgi:LysM repeat protein